MNCHLIMEAQDRDRSSNSSQLSTDSEICENLCTLSLSRQKATIDLKKEDSASSQLATESSNHLQSFTIASPIDSEKGTSPQISPLASKADLSQQTGL